VLLVSEVPVYEKSVEDASIKEEISPLCPIQRNLADKKQHSPLGLPFSVF
jgi:hypothetical protein